METLELRKLPVSKAGTTEYIKTAVEELLNGEHDILDSFVRLKILKEIIEGILEDRDFKYGVNDEADKYEKNFEYSGVGISRSTRSTYDYTYDPVWKDINRQIELIKKSIKQREECLRAGVDLSTGEELQKPSFITNPILSVKQK
jgi:hypothetical protein